MTKKGDTRCMWMIPKFPRKLKQAYIAFLRANGIMVREHVEYLVAKTLHENNAVMPEIDLPNLLRQLAGDVEKR